MAPYLVGQQGDFADPCPDLSHLSSAIPAAVASMAAATGNTRAIFVMVVDFVDFVVVSKGGKPEIKVKR